MKKIVFLSVLAMTSIFVLSECFNNTQKAAEKKPETKLITHKEAVDTMRADTNAPIKSLVFKKMSVKESYGFCKNNDISCILKNNYPLNGFYGEDRYRIEFFISEVKRDSFNVNLYHVKGKNRHKKVITPFEGEIRLIDIATFTDPNLDTAQYNSMDVNQMVAASGEFELREDSKSQYSGLFKGTFKTEFYNTKTPTGDQPVYTWYYSEGLPSGGAGYRFDGTWTSYTQPNMVKPVIWAEDLFRFANDILKDFSYGEREVVVNPKYRDLGWQELWEENEWWNDTPKKPNM